MEGVSKSLLRTRFQSHYEPCPPPLASPSFLFFVLYGPLPHSSSLFFFVSSLGAMPIRNNGRWSRPDVIPLSLSVFLSLFVALSPLQEVYLDEFAQRLQLQRYHHRVGGAGPSACSSIDPSASMEMYDDHDDHDDDDAVSVCCRFFLLSCTFRGQVVFGFDDDDEGEEDKGKEDQVERFLLPPLPHVIFFSLF